jgi:hypothetical protein
MNKAALIPLLCASLTFAVAGCSTLSQLNFDNGTAAAIRVESSQTGHVIAVPPGKFRKLPHATGNLVVTTPSNERFRFSKISPPVLLDRYLIKRQSPFGRGYITLNVILETNMQLSVVMPGEKTVNEKVPQPEGYPKTGEKVVN